MIFAVLVTNTRMEKRKSRLLLGVPKRGHDDDLFFCNSLIYGMLQVVFDSYISRNPFKLSFCRNVALPVATIHLSTACASL